MRRELVFLDYSGLEMDRNDVQIQKNLCLPESCSSSLNKYRSCIVITI